jgi:hypothetical protein
LLSLHFPADANAAIGDSQPDRNLFTVRYRRISRIAVRPGGGPLSDPTADAQPQRRELVLMPETVEKRVIRFGRALGLPADRVEAPVR